MDETDKDDGRMYRVVVNYEEQYSIWPSNKEIPLGWEAVGMEAQKKECLDYIKEIWTDMRPLSLRKSMEVDEEEKKIERRSKPN